jgi:hypothetical protein
MHFIVAPHPKKVAGYAARSCSPDVVPGHAAPTWWMTVTFYRPGVIELQRFIFPLQGP